MLVPSMNTPRNRLLKTSFTLL